MRGLENLSIDALYALELSMLRYKGLELEKISANGVIHTEDEGTGQLVEVLNAFLQNLLIFVFRGPSFGEMGRPRAIVPIDAFMARDGFGLDLLVENAARALEKLVADSTRPEKGGAA